MMFYNGRERNCLRIRKSFGVRIFSRALSLAYPLGYHISCTILVRHRASQLSLTLEETTITCDHKVELVDLRQTRSITTQSETEQSAAPKIFFVTSFN